MANREAALQDLHQALISKDRSRAIELLADVLITQGFVSAADLFESANGATIAPDVWSAALTKIAATPEGAVIQNVLQSHHHCHLMGVYPPVDEQEPPFTYSIGLWYNFHHPEIVCIGLPNQVAGVLINDYAQAIATGQLPPRDTPITGALANDYQLQFKLCGDQAKTLYTCWASWFNGGTDYPLLQLIWQDKQYRWPWEAGFHPLPAQPLL
jgi:Domain of unknown function (DUF4262)